MRQKDTVTVTAWKDNRIVRVMSTASDPTASSTVNRRCRTGEKIAVPCPQCIEDYNRLMGGVDRGDQMRGYYRCPTKFHKFYMYIYSFLMDVCVTNSYILHSRYSSPSNKSKTSLSFRLRLAEELIGSYASRKRGVGTHTTAKTLPIAHFPLHHQEGCRGRCHLCKSIKARKDSLWFCQACQKWFCHTGDTSTDCFMTWHKRAVTTT